MYAASSPMDGFRRGSRGEGSGFLRFPRGERGRGLTPMKRKKNLMSDWKEWLLWILAIVTLGLVLRQCDDRTPDYGCIEEVTPWGVECA